MYSPTKPLLRQISRTASTVPGAFANRIPLLAAIEYSSCRLTYSREGKVGNGIAARIRFSVP